MVDDGATTLLDSQLLAAEQENNKLKDCLSRSQHAYSELQEDCNFHRTKAAELQEILTVWTSNEIHEMLLAKSTQNAALTLDVDRLRLQLKSTNSELEQLKKDYTASQKKLHEIVEENELRKETKIQELDDIHELQASLDVMTKKVEQAKKEKDSRQNTLSELGDVIRALNSVSVDYEKEEDNDNPQGTALKNVKLKIQAMEKDRQRLIRENADLIAENNTKSDKIAALEVLFQELNDYRIKHQQEEAAAAAAASSSSPSFSNGSKHKRLASNQRMSNSDTSTSEDDTIKCNSQQKPKRPFGLPYVPLHKRVMKKSNSKKKLPVNDVNNRKYDEKSITEVEMSNDGNAEVILTIIDSHITTDTCSMSSGTSAFSSLEPPEQEIAAEEEEATERYDQELQQQIHEEAMNEMKVQLEDAQQKYINLKKDYDSSLVAISKIGTELQDATERADKEKMQFLQEIREKNNELDTARRQYNHVKKKHETAQKDIVKLEQDLKIAHAKVEDAVKFAKAKSTDVESNKDKQKKEIEKLRHQLAISKENEKHLKQQYELSRNEVQKLHEHLKVTSQKVKFAQKKQNERDGHLRDLMFHYKQLQGEYENAISMMKQLDFVHSSTDSFSVCKSKSSDCDESTAGMSTINESRFDALKRCIDSVSSAYEKLKQEYDIAVTQIESLENQLLISKHEAETLRTEREILSTRIDQLERDLVIAKKALDSAQREQQVKDECLEAATELCAELEAVLEEKKEQIASLEEDLDGAVKQRTGHRDIYEFKKLEREIEDASVTIDAYDRELEAVRREARIRKEEAKGVRKRLAGCHFHYKKLQSEYDEVLAQIHSKDIELKNAIKTAELLKEREAGWTEKLEHIRKCRHQTEEENKQLAAENEEMKACCESLLTLVEQKQESK